MDFSGSLAESRNLFEVKADGKKSSLTGKCAVIEKIVVIPVRYSGCKEIQLLLWKSKLCVSSQRSNSLLEIDKIHRPLHQFLWISRK